MSEEELLRKNNVLMSHGNLPCDTTTCETYGLSGNCGKDCSNFKSKTCDVYVDVLERINEELQEENQKYKEVIDYLKEEIKKTKESWGNSIYNNNEKGMFEVQIEIRLLEELLSKIEKSDK